MRSATWRVLVARAREWLRGAQLERDLAEEIQSHLDLLADEYRRRGWSPEQARAAARRAMGGIDQVKERVRDRRGFPMFEAFWHDVRYGMRLLAKTPSFTGVVILTLALGIGVNAAIFGLFDAVLLRPLPYQDSRRLVSIWEVQTRVPPAVVHSTGRPIGPAAATADTTRLTVSPANFVDYRRRATSFSGMAAFAGIGRNLTGVGTPQHLLGEIATQEYFAVLGASPALGRPFRADEDREGAPRVVIVSDALWRDRLNGDAEVLGGALRLDGESYEIVGVMPAGFRSLTGFGAREPVSFWVPAAFAAELLANHGDHEVNVVARLAPGVSIEVAAAELAGISQALATEYPQTNAGIRAGVSLVQHDLVRNVRGSFLVLLLAVGLILVIACVNVANLLLVRAVSRRREIAVRMALGASRWRVTSELMTQSALLAVLGCGAGLAVGYWTQRLLVAAAPATIPRLESVALDTRVLAFTIGVSVMTSLVFGLAPAWQLGLARPIDALKAERVVAGTSVLRWRSALMVAEVTLSTVLLICAALMLRSLYTLNRVELGFQSDRVLALNINLPELRYATPEARLAFFEALLPRVTSLPGVRSAAFANRMPLRGGWSGGFTMESSSATADGPVLEADLQAVSPGYFRTLGIALLRGRLLASPDRGGTLPVAVVSESFSRRLLHGADPIGRRFRRHERAPWITIVGLVSDVRRDGKAASLEPQVYLSAAQTETYPVRLADLAVRTEGDPRAVTAAIQAEVWRMDREQPVTNVRTLDEILSERGAERRFQTLLFVLFAGLALTLAVVGIYGVVAYAVSQRTAEIGLRMALGADGGRILRWILGEAGRLVIGGALAGVAGAVLMSRYLASLLFEVAPTDPGTYAAAAALLAGVALATSYVAGRRSTRIDPVTALRLE